MGGGGAGEGGVEGEANFFCLIFCSTECLLYVVVQDFVKKTLFSEIQAIRRRWGNYV